jgi:hypothetical protein
LAANSEEKAGIQRQKTKLEIQKELMKQMNDISLGNFSPFTDNTSQTGQTFTTKAAVVDGLIKQ